MNEIKVGDRIRILVDHPEAADIKAGEIGTITAVVIDSLAGPSIRFHCPPSLVSWYALTSNLGSTFELVKSHSLPGGAQIQHPMKPMEELGQHKCRCVFRDLLMNGCQCGGA